MPVTLLNLEDLGPHREALQKDLDFKAAMAVICPQPDLRVGLDSHGYYRLFRSTPGKTGPDQWHEYEPCPDQTLEAIFALYGSRKEACRLAHYRGPSGCQMLYHIDEEPP